MDGPRRILIGGLGNIFLGDDAFGVEVFRCLLKRPLPPGVRIADFGINGMALADELLQGYDMVILLDAVARGGRPGTLYVIEPEIPGQADKQSAQAYSLEGHDLDPAKAIQFAVGMGAHFGRLLLVGCEPTPLDKKLAFGNGLTPPVQGAVEQAAEIVMRLIKETTVPAARPLSPSAGFATGDTIT